MDTVKTKSEIISILKMVINPENSQNIIASGAVTDVITNQNSIKIIIAVRGFGCGTIEMISSWAENLITQYDPEKKVIVMIDRELNNPVQSYMIK